MTHAQRICTIALAIACLLESFTGRPTLAAEPKRVLLLYYSFGGNLVNARQFRAELERQSKELLEIYDAPLLSARPVDEPIVRRYAEYLHALLPDKRLDLVVPVGASAARLLYQYRSQLFPAAPVLAIAEGRRLPAELEVNGAVIATSIDITKIIENILQVRPETTNIAVVVGNSTNERFWVQETQAAFRPYAERVSIEYFNDLPFDEMLKRAATLPPRSAIFFFVLLTDAAGTTHEDVTVFSRLYAVANAPIFSYYDVNFGKGIVGGPLLSVEDRSRLAASVALRILAGEAPGSIKTPPIGFAAPKFDWREMQRWGISESNLPPGSEIHFVEVYTELDEQAPTVVGDKVQLQQVILNLVMNASEAMHSVRPRVLKVKSEQRKPNTVHVSIEDNGTGVDLANLDRIFKPLFTTKDRGMGVGLSICHSIIQNHDGRIWVSPAAGRGSIFQFELPVHRHNGPQTGQKPSDYAMSAD
jgi:hypothetical protein